MLPLANIRRLYLFACLKMMLFPMAIITLFWKDQIGLTLTEIMILQGIFSAACFSLEYPSGYISDRLGYRMALVIASSLGVIGWGLYTIADSFPDLVLAEIILGVSFAFTSGSDSALLYETLQAHGLERQYVLFDGRMNGFAQCGEAFGALAAGLLYVQLPVLPFAIQVAVWLLALFVAFGLVESPPAGTSSGSHLNEAFSTIRMAWVRNRSARSTIVFATIIGMASFYPVWLIQPYMQLNQVPVAWFGPIWAGANLTVALFAFLSFRFTESLGPRNMLLLFLLLVVTGYLGLGLGGGMLSFLFYYLLTMMRGLQGPFTRHYLQLQGERRNRASLLSLKAFSFRVVFVVSGPLVGLACDRYGIQPTFLALAPIFLLLGGVTALAFYRHNINPAGEVEPPA